MKDSSLQGQLREIAIADIDRSHNHRIPRPNDAARLEETKQSIAAVGQLQAIRVYKRGEDQKDPDHKEPYILCFGARRCKALELLERKTVIAIVFPPAPHGVIAQARAVENLQRQDLCPMEEVMAVADVLDPIRNDPEFKGDPFEEAAARLGCEVEWVREVFQANE